MKEFEAKQLPHERAVRAARFNRRAQRAQRSREDLNRQSLMQLRKINFAAGAAQDHAANAVHQFLLVEVYEQS